MPINVRNTANSKFGKFLNHALVNQRRFQKICFCTTQIIWRNADEESGQISKVWLQHIQQMFAWSPTKNCVIWRKQVFFNRSFQLVLNHGFLISTDLAPKNENFGFSTILARFQHFRSRSDNSLELLRAENHAGRQCRERRDGATWLSTCARERVKAIYNTLFLI